MSAPRRFRRGPSSAGPVHQDGGPAVRPLDREEASQVDRQVDRRSGVSSGWVPDRPLGSDTGAPGGPDHPTGGGLAAVPLFAAADTVSEEVPAGTNRGTPTATGLLVPSGVGPARSLSRAGSRRPEPAGGNGRIRVRDHQTQVDWGQVVILRKAASELITEQTQAHIAESGRPMPSEDRLLMGRAMIRRVVADHVRALHREGAALWSPETEYSYVRSVEDAVFGYGRLQPLLDLPDAENIEIHGWDSVVVQYGDGRRDTLPPVADSDEELVDAIRFLGENADPSRPFDDTHPTMTLALGSRFRLHAIGFGLSYRPSVVIRQHILTDVSLADLASAGMMPEEIAEFLDAAVLARKSIVISGDQGAGKTTLLRALINAIPVTERFGTLETDYELMTHLQPGRTNILALQARVGHGEVQGRETLGNVTVADLMPEALRQNLSRLIVGEVRGGEAAAMFEAMQAGTGTLSTTHSHSAASTMDRLASRVAQGGVLTIEEAYRQIAHNIALFVHIRLIDDTWKGGGRRRFVSEIRQVTGAIEGDRPTTHLTYDAVGSEAGGRSFFPDAGFASDLAPFRRPLPGGDQASSQLRADGEAGAVGESERR